MIFALLGFSMEAYSQGEIVNVKGTIEDRFPKRIGALRFSETTIHLGEVYNNQEISDTIKVYNNSDAAITISNTIKLPAHLKIDIQPLKVESLAEALVIVSYSTSGPEEFGFVLDRIILQTNDTESPDKHINITANIKEYFPPVDSTDTLAIQKARVPEKIFNFGRIQQGEKSLHDFLIINDGQKELIVHHAKTNCGCIKTTFSKNSIAPGDSAIVSMQFDSFGKEGEISKEVSIYVNDPLQPRINLVMKGDVWK